MTHGVHELRSDWVRCDDGRLALAMMRCGKLAGPLDIPMSVLSDGEPAEAALYRPDRPEPLPLNWTRRGERFYTLLPAVARHAVATYRLK